MTNTKLASVGLALMMSAVAVSEADARSRHNQKKNSRDSLVVLLRQNVALSRQQAIDNANLRREIAAFKSLLRPDTLASADAAAVPMPLRNPALAAAMAIPDARPAPVPVVSALHVFPVTGTQGGQFGDQRGTHRHAGIDIRAPNGSPVVAAIGGRVIPKCKGCGDRGYGPHVVLILGNDGILYRYAHLSRVEVRAMRAGQRVATGERIGDVGLRHLHYEARQPSRHPRDLYGLRLALNPNDYLGGGRGTRMVAGTAMTGEAAKRYALRFAPSKVAEAP